jgi:hypothetical protein
MTIIALPIWILAAAVGIPTICLFWLVIALFPRRPKALHGLQAPGQYPPYLEQRSSGRRFQSDLIALQIDAVFNGLEALIETERIKLKTLVNENAGPGMPGAEEERQPVHRNAVDNVQPGPPVVTRPAVQDPAVRDHADGGSDRSGLSAAEVDLAMKLRALKRPAALRKLEAVA